MAGRDSRRISKDEGAERIDVWPRDNSGLNVQIIAESLLDEHSLRAFLSPCQSH
jgi:hypothetical protein